MIAGLGVDIIETERIGQALDRYGARFTRRLLSKAEWEDWQKRGGRLDTLAGYWAGKEAIAKALGTGFRGFSFRDITISHDDLGRPRGTLHGQALVISRSLDVTSLWLAISHTADYAMATAVLEAGTSPFPPRIY